MDFQIKNKSAIVCASSQGLGKAAAMALAAEGVNLAICSRNEEKLKKVKKEIESTTDSKIISIVTDLNQPKDIKNLYQKASSELGPIDILINNAGGPPPSTFASLNDDDWLSAFNLTMMSSIRLSKLVLPEMKNILYIFFYPLACQKISWNAKRKPILNTVSNHRSSIFLVKLVGMIPMAIGTMSLGIRKFAVRFPNSNF